MLWVCLVGRQHLQRYAAVKSTLILLSASLNTTRTAASERKDYFFFIRKKDLDFSSLCVKYLYISVPLVTLVSCICWPFSLFLETNINSINVKS
jgi:hypothetical protein